MASCLNKNTTEPDLKRAADAVRAGGQVEFNGLWGSSVALIIAHWLNRFTGFAALVTANEQEAVSLKEDLEFFLNVTVPLYPAAEHDSVADAEKRAILSERLAILSALTSRNRPACLVAPASGFLMPVPSKEDLDADSLLVAPNDRLNLEEVKRRLREAGFLEAPMVTAPAEYSFRGDIVDIYPMAFERPIRIELFDEEVESIREIDLETQCSVARLERICIPLPQMEAKKRWTDLHSMLPEKSALVRLEPHRIDQNLKIHSREFSVDPSRGGKVEAWMASAPGLNLHRVSTGRSGALEFKVFPAQGTGRLLSDIRPSIEALHEHCSVLKILCRNQAEASRLKEVMIEQDVPPSEATRIEIGRVADGFLIPSWDVGYINHHELLQRLPARQAPKPRAIKALALQSYSELKADDLVVHLVHGIARYAGMIRMDREGGQEDFLKLEFESGTLLYVPASKVHLVEKYIGGGCAEPKLDKLGR
ncbi:MAG: CarD family transcriptional regulator [Planctomycetota bacterium]